MPRGHVTAQSDAAFDPILRNPGSRITPKRGTRGNETPVTNPDHPRRTMAALAIIGYICSRHLWEQAYIPSSTSGQQCVISNIEKSLCYTTCLIIMTFALALGAFQDPEMR